MPTVKMDINTGLEYSASDGITGQVKLHNFTVGHDGSLYKLPALRNLQTPKPAEFPVNNNPGQTFVVPSKIWDLKKRGSLAYYINEKGFDIKSCLFYNYGILRNFYCLTENSVLSFNIDERRFIISNDQLPPNFLSSKGIANLWLAFEHEMFDYSNNYAKDFLCGWKELCIIPAYVTAPYSEIGTPNAAFVHRKNPWTNTPSSFLANVPQVLRSNFTVPTVDIYYTSAVMVNFPDGPASFMSGPVCLGNRLFFYQFQGVKSAIILTENNQLDTLQKADATPTSDLYRVVVLGTVYGIKEFNGDLLVFTESGIERWVLNANAGDTDKRILLRDSSFKYHYKCPITGAPVNANKDLYFQTDDLALYVLRSNLTVEPIFQGKPPLYNPVKVWYTSNGPRTVENKMCYFKMLGYYFLSFGAYLYNITTKTLSTYGYDGWIIPEENWDPNARPYFWPNQVEHRIFHAASEDITCLYSTISTPLTYEEMSKEITDETKNSLIAGGYQWGNTAMFCSRIYQDTKTFSVDAIMVYVRGGTLKRGDKVWLKILKGEEPGEIDEFADTTWGVSAEYQPLESDAAGYSEKTTGYFKWNTNVKTNRFRVQVVTDCRRPLVIEAVLANIAFSGTSSATQIPQQAQ